MTASGAAPEGEAEGARGRLAAFRSSFQPAGLLAGTLFFAFSLTPTLLPRGFMVQGVLSGVAFASGYGIGVLLRWLWSYLELPRPHGTLWRIATAAAVVACALTAAYFLWHAAEWQNSIRELMRLEPVNSAHPLEVTAIAAVTALALILAGRGLRLWARAVARWANRYVPRRISGLAGIAAAFALLWLVADGVVARAVLYLADSSYLRRDSLFEPQVERPTQAGRAGSPASLVRWEDLGRAGREFVASGPTAGEIESVAGGAALEPVRVFVGLASADTAEERAALALAELRRAGGFDRSVLVIVTPTGTGWIDDAAMDSLEYLLRGDVASVALQYSYLSSPFALLTEPEYGAEAARALFRAVYGHWTTLPRDGRPRLYLHGLSLGAMNSELSTDLFEVLSDPFHGALWSGPPYRSRLWNSITAGRDPASPAWLPRFRDGSFVRFVNQASAGDPPAAAEWGPMRIVYLQYASDPVTFFRYGYLYREPEWLRAPRGPDVSPQLRWYPVVTLLQLTLDMAFSTAVPHGYGHLYAPEHYADAWLQLTDAQGWPAERLAALKRRLRQAMAAD